ncbi:hypothetical protein MBLNU457_g0359t1 [Dothideomycetes sp. NU457]
MVALETKLPSSSTSGIAVPADVSTPQDSLPLTPSLVPNNQGYSFFKTAPKMTSPSSTKEFVSNFSFIRPLFDHYSFYAMPNPEGTASQPLTGDTALARNHLLCMMPSQYDTRRVIDTTWDWWATVDEIAPPLSIDSGDDLVRLQDSIATETQNYGAASVGVWLLNMATTVHHLSLSSSQELFHNWNHVERYPTDVCNAVRSLIIDNDNIAMTTKGLECCLLLVRLSLNLGRAKTAWLIVRRAISLAELSGLSRSVRSPTDMEPGSDAYLRGSIWIGLSVIDKFFGAMFNLPSITRDQTADLPDIYTDGLLTRQCYWKLAVIASKISMRNHQQDRPEYSKYEEEVDSIRRIGKDLQWTMDVLNSTPLGTEGRPKGTAQACAFMQFCSLHLELICSLPSMLRNRLGPSNTEIYETNYNTAKQIVEIYIYMSKASTPNFVMVRMIDFVAFSAGTVLMRNKTSGSIKVFEQLMETLRTACAAQHRPIAEMAITSLTQLRSALEGHGDSEPVITIPLLGSIRLRKHSISSNVGDRDDESNGSGAGLETGADQMIGSREQSRIADDRLDDSSMPPPSSLFDAELIMGPYADLDNIWEMFDMM